MARPLKPVNSRQVYRLARIGCTSIEIATVCDVSVDTLERRFADIIKKGREKCKMSLRRLQLRIAHEGNPTMAIWLGKQMLGQRDKQDIEVTVNDSEAYEEAIRTVMSDPDFTGTKADAIRWIKDNIKSGPLAQVDSVLASERIH